MKEKKRLLVSLGDEYRDCITEVNGIATARCVYIDGTPRVRLEFKNDSGEAAEFWVEETRLDLAE